MKLRCALITSVVLLANGDRSQAEPPLKAGDVVILECLSPSEGNRYLDFFPGWGCDLIGHCPPRVVEAVKQQVGRLIHVPNTWYTEEQGQLAQALSERTGWGGQCFFCNSGTEAVEGAIKLARLNGRPGRYKIVDVQIAGIWISQEERETFATMLSKNADIRALAAYLAGETVQIKSGTKRI